MSSISNQQSTYGYQLHGLPNQEERFPQNINFQECYLNNNNNTSINNNNDLFNNKNNFQSRLQTKKNNESIQYNNGFIRENANPKLSANSQQSKFQIQQGNAQQIIPDWYENKRIPTTTSFNKLNVSNLLKQVPILYSQVPEIQAQQISQSTYLSRNSPQKKIFCNDQVLRQFNRNLQYPISNQNNQEVQSQSDNLQSNNKISYHPIFSNNNLQNQNQGNFDADISAIQASFVENEQVKHQKNFFHTPYENNNQDKVKHSHNINSSQKALYSPIRSTKNTNSKKIFGNNNDNLNKSNSYIKNVEILNSEDRIKKSKIFQDKSQSQITQHQLVRSNYQEDSQIKQNDKYARERAIKEQELKRLTLEQVFCQNCLEFIHYETSEIVDLHCQNCKTIEESARQLTIDFIQKERDLHNSFIDETDYQSLENQQLIQIINTKLEKLRYLFMKMTNVLEESDFLTTKPEIKVYNLVEIKKSLERILNQDQDSRFLLSCLNNIESQYKDIDLIQKIYCTPESTQFLQIITTIPEIVNKKIEVVQRIQFIQPY